MLALADELALELALELAEECDQRIHKSEGGGDQCTLDLPNSCESPRGIHPHSHSLNQGLQNHSNLPNPPYRRIYNFPLCSYMWQNDGNCWDSQSGTRLHQSNVPNVDHS